MDFSIFIPSQKILMSYWSHKEIITNIIIFMNLAGALALGLIIGYERSYHGRAAGMRTYGLVCTASCALVILSGYPLMWYGGNTLFVGPAAPDPTRVIQGVVTGIGFLGAGVIMRDGLSISGLTTAASIWASSAIGVMVGVGFYGAAILLTLLSAICMTWVSWLEQHLPSKIGIAITLQFKPGFTPKAEVLKRISDERGYDIAWGSLRIEQINEKTLWHYVAIGRGKKSASVPDLAAELKIFEGVEDFHIAHARN